jgi:hypothetical protein
MWHFSDFLQNSSSLKILKAIVHTMSSLEDCEGLTIFGIQLRSLKWENVIARHGQVREIVDGQATGVCKSAAMPAKNRKRSKCVNASALYPWSAMLELVAVRWYVIPITPKASSF